VQDRVVTPNVLHKLLGGADGLVEVLEEADRDVIHGAADDKYEAVDGAP